jgi:hypothetical protein
VDDVTPAPHGDPERAYTIQEVHRLAPDCPECGRLTAPRGLPPGEADGPHLRFRWRDIRFHCAACSPLKRG